jgi:hypothetical protein
VSMATIYFALILSNVFLPVVMIRWVADIVILICGRSTCITDDQTWSILKYFWLKYRLPNPFPTPFRILTLCFLDAFAKLQKATIGFVVSAGPNARPSVRIKNSAPTVRIFTKFDIRVFFEKLSRKFQFH